MSYNQPVVGAPPAQQWPPAASPNQYGQIANTKRKSNNRLYMVAGLATAAVIAGACVAIFAGGILNDSSNESDTVSNGGPGTSTATQAPLFAVPQPGQPSKSPTVPAPTKSPVTSSPTDEPEIADCTIMFGDMRDASSPFSVIVQEKTDTDLLVTAVYDTSHVVSPASQTSTLMLEYKDPNGNPYNIGLVTGSVTVGSNMATTMSVTVNDPNFYIKKMSAVTSGSQLDTAIFNPDEDQVTAYLGTPQSPSTVTVLSKFPVIAFDIENAVRSCTSSSTPLAACAGPWYSYHVVEICPRNVFATKAPGGTPPTPLATPAPSTATPLIDIVYTNPTTSPAIRATFANAIERWHGIITNTHEVINLPAGTTNAGAFGCGDTPFPAGTTQIKGLTIFADIGYIDGVNGILGQAGPCAYSYSGATSSKFGNVMPRIGSMKFDSVDLQSMIEDGSLERVIMHEIGHILGIGTLWDRLREGSAFVNGALVPGSDPRYVGVNGVEGYRQIGGMSDDIPVANTGGGGTADGHWREATFADELMSGYASGAMPASMMTVKSLKDLGYVVDPNKAEAYSVPLVHANDFKDATRATFGDDILEFNKKKVMTFSPNNLD